MASRMAFAALSICLIAACNSSAPDADSSSAADTELDEDIEQLKADILAKDGQARDVVFASFVQSYPILDKGDVRYNDNAYNKVIETSRLLEEEFGFPGSQAVAAAVLNVLGPVKEHSAYDEFWSRVSSKSRIVKVMDREIEEVTLTIARTNGDGLHPALLRQQLHELAIREVCFAPDDQKPDYPRDYKVLGADGMELATVFSNDRQCSSLIALYTARCTGLFGESPQLRACGDSFYGRVPRLNH